MLAFVEVKARATREAADHSLDRRRLQRVAAAAEAAKEKKNRACILLWMSGGPSQLDTFDPKPGHANGGPVKAIPTAVPGLKISEYLPGLAKRANDLAILRGMTTKGGDHGRAT